MGLTEKELRQYLQFQMMRFAEYKYELGLAMGHDPLDFFSMDELVNIYIRRHGQDLHNAWFKDNKE